MRIFSVLVIAIFIIGCESTQVRHAAIEVEQAAIVANDLQLELAQKSLCASAFSAIGREFGGNPEMLKSLMTLCGWGSHDISVLTGAQRE